MSELIYKTAESTDEIEQVHRLNYITFVEEIRQHTPNHAKKLIDKFHKENTYLIALKKNKLVGMLAIRGRRPFSLDLKLGSPVDKFLPPDIKHICEVRLLSVARECRGLSVIHGLLKMLEEYSFSNGYDGAVISGILSQEKLYRHLGFTPFGPLVGDENAKFQPMYILRGDFGKQALKKFKKDVTKNVSEYINMLPGPVTVSESVAEQFSMPPVSHRSEEFIKVFSKTKKLLTELTGTFGVSLLFGSGTLANDAVAAQLSLLNNKGIILTNGEFGRRLIAHAKGFQLNFDVCEFPDGEEISPKSLQKLLSLNSNIKWLWMVHSETSTGVLNDVAQIEKITKKYDVKLILDAISAIGSTDTDLSGIYLASGVSGKALAAFSGIAMVFYNHPIKQSFNRIPRYLDIAKYTSESVPFTASSNLLYALYRALQGDYLLKRRLKADTIAAFVRKKLSDLNLNFSSKKCNYNPHIISIDLPGNISSVKVGEILLSNNILTAYESEHLRKTNRLQICFFGESDMASAEKVVAVTADILCPHRNKQ